MFKKWVRKNLANFENYYNLDGSELLTILFREHIPVFIIQQQYTTIEELRGQLMNRLHILQKTGVILPHILNNCIYYGFDMDCDH